MDVDLRSVSVSLGLLSILVGACGGREGGGIDTDFGDTLATGLDSASTSGASSRGGEEDGSGASASSGGWTGGAPGECDRSDDCDGGEACIRDARLVRGCDADDTDGCREQWDYGPYECRDQCIAPDDETLACADHQACCVEGSLCDAQGRCVCPPGASDEACGGSEAGSSSGSGEDESGSTSGTGEDSGSTSGTGDESSSSSDTSGDDGSSTGTAGEETTGSTG